MIVVTTLKGERLAINDDLIERVEDDHPTRVILTSGTCYMVAESVEEIVRRCQEDRAEVHAMALGRTDQTHAGASHALPDGHRLSPHHPETGDDPDEKIVRIDRFTAPPDGGR